MIYHKHKANCLSYLYEDKTSNLNNNSLLMHVLRMPQDPVQSM
jgi:hypothetical protein